MAELRRPALSLATVLVAMALAACNIVGTQPDSQGNCGGVSREAGGCSTERHTYVATTCDDAAKEWAAVLDAAVVGVLNGPDVVDDNARSVRLGQQLVISAVDLNEHLRQLRLREECSVAGVMAIAEPLFSEQVRSGAGAALYDGQPVATYDEWLADVRKVLGVIDDPG